MCASFPSRTRHRYRGALVWCEPFRSHALVWLPPEPGRAWMLGWRGPHEAPRENSFRLSTDSSVDVAHGSRFSFRTGTKAPSIMGIEDEVERSLGDLAPLMWRSRNSLLKSELSRP
jgi:hypothetical protein